MQDNELDLSIETKQYHNVVSQDVIQRCLAEYNDSDDFYTPDMKIACPGIMRWKLRELVEDAVGAKLVYCSGNYYTHSYPYLLHTDYKIYQDNTINVVIPLIRTGTASLVIFDQLWPIDSVTWCLDKPVKFFTPNTAVKGCPYEYPVQNLTGEPIDDELYSTYLTQHTKECLFGLSGSAYSYDIGSMIVFDNRLIHGTSVMTGEKTGISLRFKYAKL